MYKEVMSRTRLRNKFIDSKTDANKIRKKKPITVNLRDVTDNKTFGEKQNLFFQKR